MIAQSVTMNNFPGSRSQLSTCCHSTSLVYYSNWHLIPLNIVNNVLTNHIFVYILFFMQNQIKGQGYSKNVKNGQTAQEV